jgi:DNA-binding NtrC family response regulator
VTTPDGSDSGPDLTRPAPRLTAGPGTPKVSELPVHVLVVDDEPSLRRGLARILTSRGYTVGTAEDGASGLAYIEQHSTDVALVDITMPGMNGLELLARAKEICRQTEVIMMTAHGGVAEAVQAVKLGAYQFLTKPFVSNDAVLIAVAQAAEHKRLLDRTRRLEERLEAQEQFGELIGAAPKMLAVYKLVEGVASATSTVLILGETGTGKELIARAIHQRSPRASRPFVAVNCAAIPKDLVESELFGHVRGAFTGAQAARAGLFESAHTGTIFLDEVGDLPLAAQVKLLRTLQEGEVKRVGSDETKLVDVRVVAATNVDLKSKIESGAFRSDLYYRLNVIRIVLPPLHERGADIEELAYHFIRKCAKRMGRGEKPLAADALAALRTYSWPGNVRELEHAMERALVLSAGDSIRATDLPFDAPPTRAETPAPTGALQSSAAAGAGLAVLPRALADLPFAEAKKVATGLFEDAYVVEVMRRADGNVSEAARQAGVDRSNFKRIARKAKV